MRDSTSYLQRVLSGKRELSCREQRKTHGLFAFEVHLRRLVAGQPPEQILELPLFDIVREAGDEDRPDLNTKHTHTHPITSPALLAKEKQSS